MAPSRTEVDVVDLIAHLLDERRATARGLRRGEVARGDDLLLELRVDERRAEEVLGVVDPPLAAAHADLGARTAVSDGDALQRRAVPLARVSEREDRLREIMRMTLNDTEAS